MYGLLAFLFAAYLAIQESYIIRCLRPRMIVGIRVALQ